MHVCALINNYYTYGTWSVFIKHITHSHSFIQCMYVQHVFIHHTAGEAVRGNLGLSILLKDTSACAMEETGIKLPTLWIVDGPLYILRVQLPLITI